MVQLSPYGERVVDRLNMIGMWLAVMVCVRNFVVSFKQYRRTRGKIHLVNMAQIVVFFIHRLLYGLIPLFEITTCVYYPLLVSLWHINYILFYTVMFMRLIILESDKNSRWIKVVGVLLITFRFADWPYELAYNNVKEVSTTIIGEGTTCWASWGNGVLIVNFIADTLATLFLSGMFVRRLYIHINTSKSFISQQNRTIEYIARKSLWCLVLTFVVNFSMNILKVTSFLNDRSDAFTVYFELIESTLLVEALRFDQRKTGTGSFCDNCGMEIKYLPRQNHSNSSRSRSDRKYPDDEYFHATDAGSRFHSGQQRQTQEPKNQTLSFNIPKELMHESFGSISHPGPVAFRETASSPAFGTDNRGTYAETSSLPVRRL